MLGRDSTPEAYGDFSLSRQRLHPSSVTRRLMRQAGIDVFLQGALLQGGLGELPAMGHLSILVDESDRTAAQLLIAAYERGELAIDEEDAGS